MAVHPFDQVGIHAASKPVLAEIPVEGIGTLPSGKTFDPAVIAIIINVAPIPVSVFVLKEYRRFTVKIEKTA